MKKIVIIFLYFIVCMIFLTTYVRAEEVCKIELAASKTLLKPGDEVTITLSMKDINESSGIIAFLSVLDFSEDIFEIILEEDPELENELKGTEFESFNILYNGEKDTETRIKNPWYLLHLQEGGANALYGSTMGDPQIESEVVGKIKLKVKQNVSSTSTTLTLLGTEMFTAESILGSEDSSDLKGLEIQDSEIELEIKGKSTTTIEPEDEIDEIGEEDEFEEVEEVKQKEDISNEVVPYTGIEDYIPFIFIGVIISVTAYINYRKYKDI